MTALNKQALRKELLNPAIGSNYHLRKIALSLLGDLDAAEKRIAEQREIVAAAEKLVRCKGRYHSELNYLALAKLFGVTTPDLPPLEHENVHYADAAEMEIAALRQRIAELEARVLPEECPIELSDQIVDICDGIIVGDVAAQMIWDSFRAAMLQDAGIGIKGE